MRYLLKANGVVTPDAANADAIMTDGSRIVQVGTFDELAAAVPEAVVLELTGLFLAPGFIDTHVHITGNGTVSAPIEIQKASPETLLLRAAGNAQTALAEGVTTVRDLGAPNSVILPFRDAAAAGLFPAPRVLVAGAPLTRTGGHGHWWGLEADTADEIKIAVRRQSRPAWTHSRSWLTAGSTSADIFRVCSISSRTTCGWRSTRPTIGGCGSLRIV